MRRLLITVVLVLGAAHLALGVWLLAHTDAWGSDAQATGGTLVVIGAATLLAGLAILARWSWALASWLAVVSFTTAFHVLWCVMDWGRGNPNAVDVALTAAIMALCVFSWVRLMQPDGQAMLVGQPGEYAQ
jgi:hypothetical protein